MIELPVQIVSQRLIDSRKNRYIIYFDIDHQDMVALDPKEIKKAMINKIEKIDPEILKTEWQNQLNQFRSKE